MSAVFGQRGNGFPPARCPGRKLRVAHATTIDANLPGRCTPRVPRQLPSGGGSSSVLDGSRAARCPAVARGRNCWRCTLQIGIGSPTIPIRPRIDRYAATARGGRRRQLFGPVPAALTTAIEGEVRTASGVRTMAEALAPDAPSFIPTGASPKFCSQRAHAGANIAWRATVVRANVRSAFARPDVMIVDSAFPRRPCQNHVAFEPRAVGASYDDGRFSYRIHRPQLPWRHPPRDRTRTDPRIPGSVTLPPVAGGFGLSSISPAEPFAALPRPAPAGGR